MIDESSLLPEICSIECGYLSSPAQMDTLKNLTDFDEWVQAREDYGWEEYSNYTTFIYPYFLTEMAKLGIAFTWEYQHTEDFSYYAYNFPTEDKPVNLVQFKTGDKRKNFPRMSKKALSQIETTSAANELLYQMGIKNGSN